METESSKISNKSYNIKKYEVTSQKFLVLITSLWHVLSNDFKLFVGFAYICIANTILYVAKWTNKSFQRFRVLFGDFGVLFKSCSTLLTTEFNLLIFKENQWEVSKMSELSTRLLGGSFEYWWTITFLFVC